MSIKNRDIFAIIKQYKNDLVLIFTLLVLSGLMFVLSFPRGMGDAIHIFLDGEEQYTLSLEENQKYILYSTDGYWKLEEVEGDYTNEFQNYNVIVVKDHKVKVEEADCPGKDCVNQKAASKNRESIICLPHKLVIQVSGKTETKEDAVSW